MDNNPLVPNPQPVPEPAPTPTPAPEPILTPEPTPVAPVAPVPAPEPVISAAPATPEAPVELTPVMPAAPEVAPATPEVAPAAPVEPKKKSHTLTIVLVVVLALVAIAGGVLTFILLNNNGNGNNSGTENDYENDTPAIVEDEEEVVVDEGDGTTIRLGAYTFTKDDSYVYALEDETLQIANNVFVTSVGLVPYDFELAVASEDSLVEELEGYDYAVSETLSSTYAGLDALTFKITTEEGLEMYYYIFDAGNGYCFSGAVANPDYVAKAADLTTVGDLLAAAEYDASYEDNDSASKSPITIFTLPTFEE